MRGSLLCAVALCGCAAGALRPDRHPPNAPTAVRVLYQGTAAHPWGYDAPMMSRLQGVDVRHGLAYLDLMSSSPRSFDRRVVRLADGTATSFVYARTLPEMNRQLADLVARTTIPTAVAMSWGAQDAATRTLYVYGDHDKLFLLPRAGGDAVELTADLPAAYHPVFSPDGKRLAFMGAIDRAAIPKGAFYHSVYYLFIADEPFVGAAHRRRIDTVTSPTEPSFGAGGEYLYAVSRDTDHDGPFAASDHGGCLHRVRASTGEDAVLQCADHLREVDFLQSPSGSTGIFFGEVTAGGDTAPVEIRWIELPSGTVRSIRSMARASSLDLGVSPGPSDEGCLVDLEVDHLDAIDLTTGRTATLPHASDEVYTAVGPWKDGHTVYALRVHRGAPAYELVEVDVRALLRRGG